MNEGSPFLVCRAHCAATVMGSAIPLQNVPVLHRSRMGSHEFWQLTGLPDMSPQHIPCGALANVGAGDWTGRIHVWSHSFCVLMFMARHMHCRLHGLTRACLFQPPSLYPYIFTPFCRSGTPKYSLKYLEQGQDLAPSCLLCSEYNTCRACDTCTMVLSFREVCAVGADVHTVYATASTTICASIIEAHDD